MTTDPVFRVHPAINFARLGTSEEFYLSPETSAGIPVDGGPTVGGLPIRVGTENETITSADLRDAQGKLKRQAARFRIYAYPSVETETYPNGGGEEIRIGSVVGGRTVADIVWTVHLANKKANAYSVVVQQGVNAYQNGATPKPRNAQIPGDPGTPDRLLHLVIDPGPRAVRGRDAGPVRFDAGTAATYGGGDGIAQAPAYPRSFPSMWFSPLLEPSGPIETLGELRTDQHGRLLVLGAYGRTAGWNNPATGQPYAFTGDLNNAGWFDDASDGPVSATLVFDDGSTAAAAGAWVVCADPAYAPQLRNVVSLWDDVYDAWVRNLSLQPELYAGGAFDPAFAPAFDDHLLPIFRAAAMVRWGANLPPIAVRAHQAVDRIGPGDDPNDTVLAGLAFIRNPNQPGELKLGVPLMPLSLGDSGNPFLAVSLTQYFLLRQWSAGRARPGGAALGPGERLDIAALANCLGGRFVPGIEMTYVIRQPDLYEMEWTTWGGGPFRVKQKPLDYAAAGAGAPFLSVGWLPLHNDTTGLEPGDTSKFMAIPWQTDYNSCAVHQASINTGGKNVTNGNPTTLYWSWPAQRPVAVYPAADVVDGVLPRQKYSVRGAGTDTANLVTLCTFQDAVNSLTQWDQLGIVLQGSAIEGGFDPAYFLETASQLDDPPAPPEQPMVEWPFNANPPPPPAG